MKKYRITGLGVVCIMIVIVAVLAGLHIRTSNSSRTTASQTNSGSYIALGDSVAAGVGLKDYSDSSACDRTEQSYPKLVAAKRGYQLTSLACGGAATGAGLLEAQDVNKLAVGPQIAAAISGPRPALISMAFGANDADWTGFLQKCYSGVCGSADDTAAITARLDRASANLAAGLQKIAASYPEDTPPVLVTGYYRLFPERPVAAGCAELTGIEPVELAQIRQLQDAVDAALRSTVANYAFASFIPVSFDGHELCSQQPWIQGLGAKAPYHPTDAGQAAIADQLMAGLLPVTATQAKPKAAR